MKKAEALLGDSFAILMFGDDEAPGGDVDGDLAISMMTAPMNAMDQNLT